MARGGQRCHCFSRNASFIRTVFCEYTLYFFCCFFCDFLLFLLMVSPFFGIVVPFTVFWLGGSERRKWPAECTPEERFLVLPSPRGVRFLWQPLPTCRECGLENVLHIRRADTGRLLCPRTGYGTGDAASLAFISTHAAPVPAAPRWRKTHRGSCSAPLAARGLCLSRGSVAVDSN